MVLSARACSRTFFTSSRTAMMMRALDIESFPDSENYETISGFMMYMLRKIPKKTDFVLYDKYKFEVIDTENFKIDQILVSIVKDSGVSKESA